MYYSSFQEEGYSQNYILARKQIDELCDLTVLGVISAAGVGAEYQRIESEFAAKEPEMAGFFRMIYKNRLERLADQFISEKIQWP
jgi:hypothetical protein